MQVKIMEKAQLEKAIISIKGRAAKLQSDVHAAAVSSLHHAAQHGDITLCNRLLLALPASARRNALAAWFIKFGKLIANTDKASRADIPLLYDKESPNGWNVEGAAAEPYWELKASETGSRELDIGKALDGIESRLMTLLKSASGADRAKIEAMLKAAGKEVPAPKPAMPV